MFGSVIYLKNRYLVYLIFLLTLDCIKIKIIEKRFKKIYMLNIKMRIYIENYDLFNIWRIVVFLLNVNEYNNF